MPQLSDRLRRALGGDTARARLSRLVAPAIRTLVEAGWLTVLYASLAVLADKTPPLIGPFEMMGFVVFGILIRVAGRREPAIGALLLVLGVVGAGMLGSLVVEGSRPPGGTWLYQLGSHFAGWLAGFAVLRGAAVSTTDKTADQLEQMLRILPLLLGLMWSYTTFAARAELWLPFAVAAMWGTAMYLSGSLVGIGLARLDVLHAEVTDERQRRAWRRLVLAIGFAVVPLAIPIAVLAGIPLAAMISPIVPPIQWLLSLLAYPLAFIIWILSIVLRPVAGPLGDLMDRIGSNILEVPPGESGSREIATFAAAILSAVTLLVIALFIYLAAKWVLTRAQKGPEEGDPTTADVERSIVMPEREMPGPSRSRRRRGPVRDVVTAYLAALTALEGRPFARQLSETPADHAARVSRGEMPGAPDMRRLAAGYQIARYGERPITARENVRAVDRLRRLRRLLRASRA